MEDQAGEIHVKIKADLDDLKAGLKTASGEMNKFSATTVAAGNLMANAIQRILAAIVDFGKDSINVYAKSETAMIRLSSYVGGPASLAMEKYSDKLQEMTGFSNDTIISMQNQLAVWGLTPAQINTATDATIRYSQATGKDLGDAVNLFGQALRGRSVELLKYGLNLSDVSSRSERIDRTTDTMKKAFIDMSDKLRGTLSFSMKNFSNQLEDLQKVIGKLVAGPAKAILDWLSKKIKLMVEAISSLVKLKDETGSFVRVLEVGFLAILKNLIGHLALFIGRLVDISPRLAGLFGLNNQIAGSLARTALNIQANIDHMRTLGTVAPEEERKQRAAINDTISALQQKLDMLRKTLREEKEISGDIQNVVHLESEARIAAAKNAHDANVTYLDALGEKIAESAKSWGSVFADFTMGFKQDFSTMMEAAKGLINGFIDDFSTGLANVIVDGKSFAKEMSQIWVNLAKAVVAEIVKMIAKQLVFNALVAVGGAGAAGAGMAGAAGAAGGAGAGMAGAAGGAGAGMAGAAFAVGATVGIVGGTLVGGALAKSENDKKNAQIGTIAGTVIGGAFFGPVGAAVGGTIGGAAGATVGRMFKAGDKSGEIAGAASVEIDKKTNLLNDLRSQYRQGKITEAEYLDLAQPIVADVGSRVSSLTQQGGKIAGPINVKWQILQDQGFVKASNRKWVLGGPTGTLSDRVLWSPDKNEWISGFASGGIISEPTLLRGMRSGKLGIMGEAGPEAIVPMDKTGGITINISGTFLEADPAKWQRLIRETIVPELRRFALANSSSPVLRSRGATA